MLMIPLANPAGLFVALPDGPQRLAATLCDGSTSLDTIQQRAVAWSRAVERPVRDVTPALEAIAWAQEMPRLVKILASEAWLALGDVLSSLTADVDQQTLKDQPLVHQFWPESWPGRWLRTSDNSPLPRPWVHGARGEGQGVREDP